MGRSPQIWFAELFCASLLLIVVPVAAQGVIPVSFGQTKGRAFLVEGGGEAVAVGVSGVDLGAARLGPSQTRPSAIDRVSRIVVFPPQGGEPLALAQSVEVGQQLTIDGVSVKVESWVEQVGGRYLPFSLLMLKHSGETPVVGSPVLDASGRVAAVIYESAGKERSYAIPVDVIRRGLTAARGGAMARAWVGLVLDPKLKVPRVVRVVEGSPASSAGLREGDLLVEVDGRRLVDYGDAVNAFFLLQIGKEVTIKYRRGTEVVSTRLLPGKPR